MLDKIQDIRTRHAAAIANRERGSFDSRDDDIGVLLGEIDRLQGITRTIKPRDIPGTISLDQAKREKRCRICGVRDDLLPFTYNFGREHAHSACLKKATGTP